MGKGGVGKTTIAAAVALWLSEKGHRVTLSTTDPASHLSDALEGNRCALTVSRIDPAVETAAYVEQVLAEQSGKLDAESHALLEEDLKSPCTEEIAVFRAFARTVAEAQEGFVVLDTAPTGHTLLLLDASLAYHTEINRKTHSAPEEVSQLLSRLRDPNFTHVLIVTLPEATPVHEAAALQEDLRRAGIEPAAWIVNQSFHRLPLHDPLLAERAHRELPYLKEVLHLAQGPACLIDWQLSEPVGAEALLKIFSPT
jgi:arsenite-transporting ATPase